MRGEITLILERGDVDALIEAWPKVCPHVPMPKDRGEAEVILHIARTEARGVRMRHRAWSHRWLTERGLPSRLPDVLRPAAERIYPSVVEGVGIAVAARSPLFKPIAGIIQSSMEDAVLEVYADSRSPDPEKVRERMREARANTTKKLLGV